MKDDNNRRSVRDTVYEILKKDIVSGKLCAGTRIIETDYAIKLHVSRTPLREALRMLELDGLVENKSRQGSIVRAFTTSDIEEMYMIRNSLELVTIPYIIKNISDSDIEYLNNLLSAMDEQMDNDDVSELSHLARLFHQRLIEISGLNRVLATIKNQDDFLVRYAKAGVEKESRRKESHNEHHLIMRYIIDKDEKKLRKVMESHIERSKLICLSTINNQ